MSNINYKDYVKQGGKVGILIIVFVLFLFAKSFFTVVDAGEVGVVNTLGKVESIPLSSGFHFKNPLSSVIKMNIRTRSYTMSETPAEGEVIGDDSIQALASDGGLVWFDVTVLYKLIANDAPNVYSSLGLQYEEDLIRPAIRSTIREVAAKYPVVELYSTKRTEVQQNILQTLVENFKGRGVEVEEVLLRKVNISDTLSKSIEQKLATQQEVDKLKFEIEKASKEAERVKVEAEGQKEAQRIINESLSDKYLYYLYIKSLENREGTIYVPTNSDTGMPLFKGIE